MNRVVWYRLSVVTLLGASLWMASQGTHAQEATPAIPEKSAAEVAGEEAVNQKISTLEAALGQLRDTSPEAADLMVQLAQVYHTHGRVHGLVRVATKLVAAHTGHPQHKLVMLQMIDGLQATSRNKEVVATIRQFQQRYPDDATLPQLEVRLAQTLEQLDDRAGAAEAWIAVWKRAPKTPEGLQAGVKGAQFYYSLNSAEGFKAAAAQADVLMDHFTNPTGITSAGMHALHNWERSGEWAKLIQSGQKLLALNLPANPLERRELHRRLAENYSRLGQHANAVEQLKLARALGDTPELHRSHIQQLNYAVAKGPEVEQIAQAYFDKYPTATDRYAYLSYAPQAYLRETDKTKAVTLLRNLLPYDAMTHNNASAFVREFCTTPEKHAECEQILRDAIGKNAPHAHYLRYVLAFELLRDRMQDPVKARVVARDLITLSPSNDSYTPNTISWLLYSAASDAEFQADFQSVLASRKKFANWGQLRNYPAAWIQEALRNEMHKARATWAQEQLAKADQDPLITQWHLADTAALAPAQAARARLLEPDLAQQQSDDQIRQLLSGLAYHHRHYGSQPQRVESATIYGRLAQKFPQDLEAATLYLFTATDYAPKEVQKEAALHLMKLKPVVNDYDTWYRLMRAADSNADPELVKQAFTWIQQSQALHSDNVGYSYLIGDTLEKYGFKAEALAYWTKAVTLNQSPAETRNCSERLLTRMLTPAEKATFLQTRLQQIDDYHGWYAEQLAALQFQAAEFATWEKTLRDDRAVQLQRGFAPWGIEESPLQQFVDYARNTKDFPEAEKLRVFTVVRDLEVVRASGTAYASLLELPTAQPRPEMPRLLEYQTIPYYVWNDAHDWDRLFPYAQACLARKDFQGAATLLTSMLANIPGLDDGRRQTGQQLVGQSYARMGGTGLAIDENSPVAPLMQAALYLRLGDERLAFETYNANKSLFDQHRDQLPVDLLLFVCDSHLAAGGDENFDRVEDILRNWIVKNSEQMDLDESLRARMQLALGKTYFRAQRFDIARSEYTTVMNRYSKTPEAIEAEFGIGETFMSQKVYDQAEAVFEKLAGHRDREVVIRAEFLRGVLAHRRGDLEEARTIFRTVLDRVPSIELANQALYNLAEVYGAEQRYMDQLELLRTVGRLGRSSKRTHMPGSPLSIVVQDSDLGTSQGRTKIPVRITTEPGGDEETVFLLASAGSKGLFRVDVETRLGQAIKNDRALQLTGLDTIRCDYPPEFKAQFKSVPLSDAEIKVASDAKLDVASRQIIDETKETISQSLEREAREREEGRRASQARPADQLKPGNPIYLRVIDPDRDVGEQRDTLTIKLQAASGDQVNVTMKESEPHSGLFEGTVNTGELPAGALASDTALEHSPLMAIDQSEETAWISEPDGATPKTLSVDMKNLKLVSNVAISTPDPTRQAPVRGELRGSEDGRMWFRLASYPPLPPEDSVAGEFGPMQMRIYAGNHTYFSTWKQIVELSKNGEPLQTLPVEELQWNLPADHEDANKPFSIVWNGQFVQPRSGAVRFSVQGIVTAVMVDGQLELPLGAGNRTVDVWLARGTHELTIFSSLGAAQQGAQALRARADNNSTELAVTPFRSSDFDLTQPEAKKGLPRSAPTVAVADNVWSFQFEPIELRHAQFVIQEYLGESVAISKFQVGHEEEIYLPTKADLLSLAGNDVLEMAGGDRIVASYTDEFTQNSLGRSQILTKTLTATYHNASLQPINYEFRRDSNGQVYSFEKQLIRIDPGERFILQIVDYDMDQTAGADQLKIQVAVNDGEPVELLATEVPERAGYFTKEIDTSAKPEKDKLTVKPGDRIYCTYLDTQNTFPGHAVARETIVHVTQPSEAEIRILETRVIRNPEDDKAPPQIQYHTPANAKQPSRVAFEAPFTVEVFDRDAAKDSASSLTVQLTTSDGAKIDVKCVVSDAFSRFQNTPDGLRWALEEGRFIGQVILQLGGKGSPDVVPLSAGMPRDLVGAGVLPDAQGKATRISETLVTRVLNLTGKDIVSATYADTLRPKPTTAKDKAAQARLIANGVLICTDRDYTHSVQQLHVGEKLFLMVTDADLDISDERDVAKVTITTERGEQETILLAETLAHSGTFTGSVQLAPSEKPQPKNSPAQEPLIETYFGDTLHIKYIDLAASTETGKLEQLLQIPVVIGTDGLVQAFSKTFRDETLAVETKFHISESYFELFKSHKKLGREDEQRDDLEAGRRMLREVMEDYPNPKYVPRIAYLLGQFAQELQQHNEALDSYTLIVRQYPEHSLAPDAQFKLAQCYEQAGRFDDALEAYVTLAATYPKSPLIASVMIRISDHFFKAEKFDISAQVGDKFLERFEAHEFASRIAFRIGQCHFKAKDYVKAGAAFDKFGKLFPDDPLAPLALFWAGESFRMGGSTAMAFRRYNRCRWDHPASEAAKYSRGRLALPEMLAQFESEANAIEDEDDQQ